MVPVPLFGKNRPAGAFLSNPDLNPIEMAFAKLNALIRKAAAQTYDEL
ncbi:hypothetical protein [Paenirhodobacter sp.]